jgi:ubiquinone/menaquinone biosynthesis C-methylase UbiE
MDAFTERPLALVRRIYDEATPAELCWSHGTAGLELARLVIDGTIRRGSLVVDLGCGQGTEATFLAVQGMRVVGVDLMPGALRMASALAGHYGVRPAWVRGDVLALPVASGSADVVNDSFVFHNLRDQARPVYAREISRVLRPGGLFVLRGFSDRMEAGSGPRRLTSDDILTTFLPHLTCDHLSLFSNFPTEKRPDQRHWLAIWRRRPSPHAGDHGADGNGSASA